MTKRRSGKRERINISDDAPINSPFGQLAGLRGQLPAGEARVPDEPSPDLTATCSDSIEPRRVRVRFERKGRRGKTVTVVSGLPATRTGELLAELKRQLGCGGTLEAEDVVLQGDQVEQVRRWLERRGPG